MARLADLLTAEEIQTEVTGTVIAGFLDSRGFFTNGGGEIAG